MYVRLSVCLHAKLDITFYSSQNLLNIKLLSICIVKHSHSVVLFSLTNIYLDTIYIVIILHVAQFIKQMITGCDSNISDKCNKKKYNLELRRKLKAYTMYRSVVLFKTIIVKF